MFCIKFHAVTKRSQMHRNTVKQTETLVWGPTGWIGCVRWEKSQRDFAAPTFALIAPVHPVLHRVSCSYETIPNAPKYYETHRNISFRCNGVDWVCSLRKIPMWHCGMKFCINCTSSSRFAPCFLQLRNNTKCTQTLWNTPKHELRIQWGGSGAFVGKNTTWLHGTNYCINCTSSVCFATSFMQLRNDPKCIKILRNGPKH